MTYACNLLCVHCLSSSGRRAPDELTTGEAKALLDDWAAMQVFYINVGGGEPMTRPDFFELMEHAIARILVSSVFADLIRFRAAAIDAMLRAR